MAKPHNKLTPPLTAPNGHAVTNGELYQALYQLDKRSDEKHLATLGLLSGLRTDLSTHTQDGHPFTDRAAIVKAEIGLDAKKVGLGTASLAAFGAFVALITAIIKGRWGL